MEGFIRRDAASRTDRSRGGWRWLIVPSILVVALAAHLTSIQSLPGAIAALSSARRVPPNIVLIVTDDQRADTLWAMPNVRALLAGPGIEFTNGFVVNPLCCPSRTSILTGRYSHSTRVYTNHDGHKYGGMHAFDDHDTIATRLDAHGYRTGLFGKYLNGYKGSYIPPGWDRWFCTYQSGAYYDYVAQDGPRVVRYGHAPRDYGTDVVARQTTAFIRGTDPSHPLFAYVAPHAPHGPAIPAPGDRHAFARHVARPAAYDEADVSDKPTYVRSHPRLTRRGGRIARFRRQQLETLRAIDRMVAKIVHALEDTGRLRDTLIVFTSDNGYLWGEHRLVGKNAPYDESIRVPFVARYDAAIATPRRDAHLVLNIDLAPTFANAAGVSLHDPDGKDLGDLFASPAAPWRSTFLIEHLRDDHTKLPSYCAVRSATAVLVWYEDGERELYDLLMDPEELYNLASTGQLQEERQALAGEMRRLCSPPPPGMSLAR